MLRKVTRLILLPIITIIKKLLGGVKKDMPRTIYNEGRVVGYSAYEIYVRHAVSEGMEPVSEKEWLSATLTDGSSLLMNLSPAMLDRDGNALSTAGAHIVDIPLPTAPSRYELTTREPIDWNTRYSNYYTRSGIAPDYTYTQITTRPIPTWEQDKYYEVVAPTWELGKYYAYIPPNTYIPLQSEPTNWTQIWDQYFESIDGGQTFQHVTPEYQLTTSEPLDWSTNSRDYYTRSGVSPNYIYKRATSWKPNTYYRTVVTHVIAANTIVASLFLGTGVYENGSYWASRVGSYGQLLNNTTPLSSPTYKNAGAVEPNTTIDFSSETEKIFMYSNIVDGVVITPGTWKPNSSTPPGNDFIPDLSDSAGQQVVRLYLHSPLTTSIDILLTGFMLKSILEGMTDTTDGSLDTLHPEDGDFLGPEVFPWGNKIIFSAPSSFVDFIYKRQLTRNYVQESQATITNKSIIDIDSAHVAEYYGTGPYYQAPAPIRRQGVNATSDVPYDVLTVFNRNSILPPALYAYEINDSVESTESAYPVDTVAPGTVKIFTDDNKTSEAAAVNQIPGNVGMYRDSDYIIYQSTNIHGDKSPISDVSIVEFPNDREEGSGPCVIRHQSGYKYVASISLSSDTAGGTLSFDGKSGRITPKGGDATQEWLDGTLHWNDLLYALANNKSIDLFNNDFFRSRFKAGPGINISNGGNDGLVISESPIEYTDATVFNDFRFNVVNNFRGYINGNMTYDEWINDNTHDDAINRLESTYNYRCSLSYAVSDIKRDVIHIRISPASSYEYEQEQPGFEYQLTTFEPQDWIVNYQSYYTYDSTSGEYVPVPSSNPAPTWQANTYYYKITEWAQQANCRLGSPSFLYSGFHDKTGRYFDTSNSYKLLYDQPTNWANEYFYYYEKDSQGAYIQIPKQQSYPVWPSGAADDPFKYYVHCDRATTLNTATINHDINPTPKGSSYPDQPLGDFEDATNAFAFLHGNSTTIDRMKSNILNIKFTDSFIAELFGRKYYLTTHEPDDWSTAKLTNVYARFTLLSTQPTNWGSEQYIYYARSPIGDFKPVLPGTDWSADTYYDRELPNAASIWEEDTYYVDVRHLYKFIDTSERVTGVWNIFPRSSRASWEASCGLRANCSKYNHGAEDKNPWTNADFSVGRSGTVYDTSFPHTLYNLDVSSGYDISICGFSYGDGYNQQLTRYNPTGVGEYPHSNQINIVATGAFVKVIDP